MQKNILKNQISLKLMEYTSVTTILACIWTTIVAFNNTLLKATIVALSSVLLDKYGTHFDERLYKKIKSLFKKFQDNLNTAYSLYTKYNNSFFWYKK